LKPLSLRTNCKEAARISASVAGGSKLNKVRMLLHMRVSEVRTWRDDSPPAAAMPPGVRAKTAAGLLRRRPVWSHPPFGRPHPPTVHRFLG
jgi:hypothetical protein